MRCRWVDTHKPRTLKPTILLLVTFSSINMDLNSLWERIIDLFTPACCGGIVVHGLTAGPVVATHPDPLVFIHVGGGVPEYRFPRTGIIRNVRVMVRSNSYNGAEVLSLFVGGAPTPLTATVPAGSTGNFDISGSISVPSGERVAMMLDRSAPTSGEIAVSASYEIRLN
jgi:hypothetical protein